MGVEENWNEFDETIKMEWKKPKRNPSNHDYVRIIK